VASLTSSLRRTTTSCDAARARWHAPSRQLLGTVAVAGLIIASALLATGAAARRRLYFVPASEHAFPDWLAGPLHGADLVILPPRGAQLLAAMLLCYLVALACVRMLPARLVIAAVLLLHVVFLLAPPLLSADVFGYIDYARLAVAHDLNPYVHGAAAAPHEPVARFVGWHDIATPYGPLFTVLSLPLAWLSTPVALWACKVTAALLSLGCLALVWRIATRRGQNPTVALAFVGLNPALLAFGVGGAHNDFLLLALALAAILLVVEQRPAAGGLAGALAIGVKAPAALLLPFLVLGARPRRPAIAGACAGASALLVVALAAFGRDAFAFATQIDQQQQLVATNSVPRRLAGLLGFDAIPPALRALFGIAFVMVVVPLLWRTWRCRIDWIAAAGWATLALLLSTAWLVAWYLIWLLPLAALSGDRRLRIATLLLTGYLIATRAAYQVL
jgi:alpha-1,6-mannosyltransferase